MAFLQSGGWQLSTAPFLATYDHFETTCWLVTMREPNDDILSLSIWLF